MNIKQANDAFDKLTANVEKLTSKFPFDLIEKVADAAASLKEKMEETIEKLENKNSLNEDQEDTLDRFQSTLPSIENIATTLETLKDAAEEFSGIKKDITEALDTI